MEPFQAKKIIFDGGNSEQYVLDNLLTFGNLDDLNRYGLFELLRRRFHPGNYVCTKLSTGVSNLSLVIHHENVDPKAILEKLHEESMELATKSTDVEESNINAAIDHSKRCLIGSSDLFKKENRYGDGTRSKFGRKFDNDDHGRCDICDEIGVSFDHRISAIKNGDHYVVHKIYDARIQYGDNPEEAKSKASKYLGLLFVVNDSHWMEKTEWKLTPIDDGKMYLLEFQDVKIGYAFDVKQYFGEENVRGTLLQYSNDHSTRTIPFALILESLEANLVRPEVFDFPMSEFFYQSEYRQFVENSQKQINPYFGDQDDQSPFTDLPPNLFVKIVSYLSLKERVLVRRVNTHWRKISNNVLAVGTKKIDLQLNHMIRNWTNADLNRMMPLVAGGLESMILPKSATADPFDFEFFRPDVSFRSLLEVDISYFTLEYNLAMVLMEKASGLKTFTGNMQLDVSEDATGDRRSFKSVEELDLGHSEYGGINIGDSYLMALIELFPNIRRLSLRNLNFVSASAASVMAERLGPKLERLEMHFVTHGSDPWGDFWFRVRAISPLGVFDGIGSCVNLKTLVLEYSHYVSTGFMEALVDGCPQLETLDLSNSLLPNGSSAPLEKLAALTNLTNLTKLNVSDIEGVSGGLMPVVRQGRLQQLLLRNSRPSAELINACIRYCTGLLLLDVWGDECTTENAIEILTTYGRYGCTRRTVIRTYNQAWSSAQVCALQLAIKDGDHPHRGSFVIDTRGSSHGFVENAAEEYERANPNVLRQKDYNVGYYLYEDDYDY